MESRVTFRSGRLKIEGRFRAGTGNRGVVITHPHSLYGGDMDNPVVEMAARTYGSAGYATLRFNFRGVGGSGGFFDQGAGERKDVQGAVDHLRGRGIEEIHLAGYSFGAWVIAHAGIDPQGPGRVVMVSPPVEFMEFEQDRTIDALGLVVTGGRDEIAPPDRVAPWMAVWNPGARLAVVDGADHFYSGRLDRLGSILADFLKGGTGKETGNGAHL